MNLQLHIAQKIINESLKLAEIDLFHSNAKIGIFLPKKTKSREKRSHALTTSFWKLEVEQVGKRRTDIGLTR